jgi:DnaJ like chaperone protein
MSWLLGAGMGFLRGGPLGAIVGGTIQHFFSKKVLKIINHSFPGVTDHGVFVTCLVVVLTKIATAKGPMLSSQIQLLHRFFKKNLHYEFEELKFIDKAIAETQRLNPDIAPFVEQYKKASENHYNLLLLALAYQIALTEDSLARETQELIDQLAENLGVSYQSHDRIRQKYSLGNARNPYTILGLDYSTNAEEIKKAYREKAAQYHPDRVAHMGDDEMGDAHIQFLEIQQAFEALEKIHKL